MTNYEWIKAHIDDPKAIASELCRIQDLKVGCDGCPVQDYCSLGINGFSEWFKEECE